MEWLGLTHHLLHGAQGFFFLLGTILSLFSCIRPCSLLEGNSYMLKTDHRAGDLAQLVELAWHAGSPGMPPKHNKIGCGGVSLARWVQEESNPRSSLTV